MDAQGNENDSTSRRQPRLVSLLSNPEDALRERDNEGPVSPVTFLTAASQKPLEALTASAARIPGRLARMLREEESRQKAEEEEVEKG